MNQHNPKMDAMPDALQQVLRLLENGYRPIPVAYGSKRPALQGWTDLQITPESARDHFPESTPMNIGLITREMPVLDIDVRDEALAEEIKSEALWRWPGALQRVGEAPKVALLLSTDAPFRKLTTGDHSIGGQSHRVEVLCDGQQVVGFGRHPGTGKDYQWLGESPLEVARTDLPVVTREEAEDFLDWCDELLARAGSQEQQPEPEGNSRRETGSEDKHEISQLKRSLREVRAKGRIDAWNDTPEPIKALERQRLIELVERTEHNSLNYGDWISLGIALKSVCGDEAYEAWEAFSRKFPTNTLDEIEGKWNSFPTEARAGAGTIVHLLKKSGLSDELISSSARELAAKRQALRDIGVGIDTDTLSPITPTPFLLPREDEIPKRDWLYGRLLIRGFLSLTVAPGGTGKSALTAVEALSMAIGRSLLGESVPRKLRVWVWNGEDPQDELDRRLAAACKQYEICREDLGDRLMVDTGRKLPIKIATMERGSISVAEPMVEALVEAIHKSDIDVLIIDPFATSHLVPENDNGALNAVVDAWRRVADVTGCAIHLVHHVNKGAALNNDQGIYGARGAGALIDGVRAARYLQKMTEKEVGKLGLESAAGYFQVIDGKMNLAPTAQNARWFQLKTVRLANGDDVGVCVRWAPPDPTDGISDEMVLRVLEHLDGLPTPKRQNEQAHEWIGYAVAEVLEWDIGAPGTAAIGRSPAEDGARARLRALISKWTKEDVLVEAKVRDGRTGRDVPCLVLGEEARLRLRQVTASAGEGLPVECS